MRSFLTCYDALLIQAYFYQRFEAERIYENVDFTNMLYGAMEPATNNVYSTHGQIDPWSPMGVHEDINEFSPTVILPLESHCADLYSIRDTDSPEMLESKNRIFELSKIWLNL